MVQHSRVPGRCVFFDRRSCVGLLPASRREEGKAFLAKLGIVRIPANQVTLHPFLLGEKYQKAADKAILRKNGVASAPKAEAKK